MTFFSEQSSCIPDLSTARLDLIAVTSESLLSEQAGDGRLGEITGASVPIEWPPQDWEPHVFLFLLKRFETNPDESGWCRYIALREADGTRRLIGTLGGFRRAENAAECEVGYGVLADFRSLGYATEGIQALIAWVLSHPEIRAISAQTFPRLPASLRIMEKCGMRLVGPGDEEGTVRYRWER
jgi:RimJ/RimL family protein N-acetyltransferase